MDAVQAADSGHPGTPMALAPVAYALWQRVLRFDPLAPRWPDRDRFVLSNGHASMLLYSVLHLAGVRQLPPASDSLAVSMDDIRAFRQLGSKCPGHPEHGHTAGVETTTGPLGQGIANSVGMALAARWLASRYNRPGFELFTFRTWAICGDGCLMEGISSEAASLAGHLKLSNLCWIYDNNHITIEGRTDLAYSDDVATRFLGYGWNTLRVGDANDLDRLERAFDEAKRTTDRPTLIIVDSHIGWGAPTRQDTSAAHGEPLGEEEIRGAKRFYGWPEDAHFLVPEGVRERFADGVGRRGAEARKVWESLRAAYAKQFPKEAAELDAIESGALPAGWESALPTFPADAKGVASRVSSGKVLNAIAERVPWLLGGAADLAPSTKTRLEFNGAGNFLPDSIGRNMHFGVREHAMGAIANGLALCGLRPFASGFLIFTDYMRGSMRLSALMELPVLYIFTHDSIGLGEDGPTHQPIEQLASLRAMPGVQLLRPADANEVVACWHIAMETRHEPSIFALSRQNLPTFDRTKMASADGCARGAYVLLDPPEGAPEVILIGTGSEVSLCVAAAELLGRSGVRSRVVSMPCWQLFERQERSYRDSVLPPAIRARVAVEQASVFGWERYVGLEGEVVGMTTFGASAPIKQLQKKFGFEPEHVAEVAQRVLKATRSGAAR
ncbi:MAG: transketolase [Phycisphaeraceae bacterium]|nr:transketolase [Phycisphaeraceae bacterium]